eukprot:gene15370-17197_t
MNNDYDFLYKLLLIGDYGVGKSSLVMRYTDDTFTEGCVVTIDAKFKTRTVELDEAKINLQIVSATFYHAKLVESRVS